MKQRKASTKCLSILLIVSMLLSGICIPIAAADTESGISTNDLSLNADTSVSSLTSADLPETMTLAAAMSAGHVRRLRDEEPDLYTVVFENADGTNTAYIFSEPVKYDDNGVIRDKSTSIFAVASSDALPSAIGNASSYAYKTTNNDVKVYFGTSSSQGVSLTYQEYTIRSYPETSGGGASTYALQAQASGVLSTTAIGYASENAKNALQYASGVGRGSVLEYIPTLNGLKENIVLSSFTGQTAFAFRYETNGLALRECDGEVQFIDPETEEVVGRFAPIISYGADGERSLGSLTVTPIVENQTYRVTVNVDEQFLRDAAYPVTVDPTVTMGSANLHDLTLYHSTGVDPDTEEPMIHAGGATSLLGTQMDDPGKYRIVYWFPISSLNNLLGGFSYTDRTVMLVPTLNLGNDASGNIEAYPYLKAGTNSAFDDLGETAVYAPPPPEESDGEIYWWSHDENGDFCDITPVSSLLEGDTAINITTSVEYYLSYVDSFVDEESNIEKCAVMLISSNEDGVYDDDYIEFYTQESGFKAYLSVQYTPNTTTELYYLENAVTNSAGEPYYLGYDKAEGASTPTLGGAQFAITAGQRWEIIRNVGTNVCTIRTRYYGHANNPYAYSWQYLNWSSSSSASVSISVSTSPSYWILTEVETADSVYYTISPQGKAAFLLRLSTWNNGKYSVSCDRVIPTNNPSAKWTLKKTAFSVGSKDFENTNKTAHDDIAQWLDATGYKTVVLDMPTKAELEAAAFAFDSEIVYFSTHGRQNYIRIKGSDDNDTAIIATPNTQTIDSDITGTICIQNFSLSHTKLLIYDACLTASTLDGPNNLCTATLNSGAECVLGWYVETLAATMPKWQILFWYSVLQGRTIEEAAFLANVFYYYPTDMSLYSWRLWGNSDMAIYPLQDVSDVMEIELDLGRYVDLSAGDRYVGSSVDYASASALESFIFDEFSLADFDIMVGDHTLYDVRWKTCNDTTDCYTVYIVENEEDEAGGEYDVSGRCLTLAIFKGFLVGYRIQTSWIPNPNFLERIVI